MRQVAYCLNESATTFWAQSVIVETEKEAGPLRWHGNDPKALDPLK